MNIKKYHIYHIKDEYFNLLNDKTLMVNHENGKTRPTFYCIQDDKNRNIYWFIPMSSKIEKYKSIKENIIKKYGKCENIIIAKFINKETAFLLQNAFPIIEKYIDHSHIINNVEVSLARKDAELIENTFKTVLEKARHGVKIMFTDIKNDYSLMEKELKNERNSIKDMIKDAKEKSEKQVIKNVIKNKDLML